MRLTLGLQRDLAADAGGALGGRGVQGRAQLKLQAFARHFDHVEGGLAGRRAQVFAGFAVHEQDVAAQVGQHRGRRKRLQQGAARLLGAIHVPPFFAHFLRGFGTGLRRPGKAPAHQSALGG